MPGRYPKSAVRAIADTSRFDAAIEERDLDAECALNAIAVLPLEDRVALAVWVLRPPPTETERLVAILADKAMNDR